MVRNCKSSATVKFNLAYCKGGVELRRIIILSIVCFILISCSGPLGKTNDSSDAPGTVAVSREKAKKIAVEYYGLTQVSDIQLRHLKEQEIKLLTEKQKKFTPIYYVISGSKKGEKYLVFISSQNEDDHFISKQ